jgi:hypothetical protein
MEIPLVAVISHGAPLRTDYPEATLAAAGVIPKGSAAATVSQTAGVVDIAPSIVADCAVDFSARCPVWSGKQFELDAIFGALAWDRTPYHLLLPSSFCVALLVETRMRPMTWAR